MQPLCEIFVWQPAMEFKKYDNGTLWPDFLLVYCIATGGKAALMRIFCLECKKYDNGSEDESDFIEELPQYCSRSMSEGNRQTPSGKPQASRTDIFAESQNAQSLYQFMHICQKGRFKKHCFSCGRMNEPELPRMKHLSGNTRFYEI